MEKLLEILLQYEDTRSKFACHVLSKLAEVEANEWPEMLHVVKILTKYEDTKRMAVTYVVSEAIGRTPCEALSEMARDNLIKTWFNAKATAFAGDTLKKFFIDVLH